MVDKQQKVKAIERGLFAFLLLATFAAGSAFELLRERIPGWYLIAYVCGGLVACYLAYRAALTLAVRRLNR